MSRVGKHPVEFKEGTKVELSQTEIKITGTLGTIIVAQSPLIEISVDGNKVVVTPKNAEDQHSREMWGTLRSLINNAVIGVETGFSKILELKGVGYKAVLKGSTLDLNLGFSHNIEYALPEEVKVEITSPTEIKLLSSNKELLGLVASQIRAFRKPEPYKGKGVRYKDEYVRRKEGKKK